ncbi:MAG: ABC transporter transmembrane domain-containing protein [Pseudomonadota bacterium]|nr:ABC transporter transmembrane domain-containing protein [Pseudomonadota bacterium]
MPLLSSTQLDKAKRNKKPTRFSSYRLLKPILRQYRWKMLQAVFALLSAASATLALPVMIRYIGDAGVMENVVLLQQGFLGLFMLAVVLGITSAYRFYMVSWLGERVVSDIRQQLFSHLLRLPSAFYDQNQTGEILSRLTTDTTLVERVVGTSVSLALRNSLILIGSLGMLLFTSLKLTVWVIIMTPIAVVPVIQFARRYRVLSKESQSYVADASAYASQVLGAMDVTKSYQYEDTANSYFHRVVEDGFVISKRRIMSRSLLTLFIIILMVGALIGVMYLGSLEVLSANATLTAGQLAQFFMYAVFVATSVGSLSEVWGDLMRASGALDRIIKLLGEVEQEDKGSQVTEGQDIQFNNVSFSYPNRSHIKTLQKVSFEVKKGSMTALVGQSGAGKSTIFKMIMRYYDFLEGDILVGGVSIHDLSLSHLRKLISFVGHDTGIFPTSIRDNLSLGEAYSEEEMMAACHKASIADFIDTLPEGYDTLLGERGMLLSEGQRQRLALARAILRDTPIVMLDEATNALDAITEEAISRALSEVFADKTVLVIAHRLSTVCDADQIIVMDQGAVESVGNHQYLCKHSKIYERLAQIQLLY